MLVIYRFFVALFAFWIACLAAAAVLVIGAAAPELPQPDAFGLLTIFILTVSVFVIGFAFVPAVVAIAIAEVFALRSALFYAVAGALIGLFCGYTLGFVEYRPDIRFDAPLATNFELLGAAGIAAGLVYWLIAGRSAGFRRAESAPTAVKD